MIITKIYIQSGLLMTGKSSDLTGQRICQADFLSPILLFSSSLALLVAGSFIKTSLSARLLC